MSGYLRLYISFLFAVFVVVLPFPASASWQPEITIGIMQGASSVQFSTTGGKTSDFCTSTEKRTRCSYTARKDFGKRAGDKRGSFGYSARA